MQGYQGTTEGSAGINVRSAAESQPGQGRESGLKERYDSGITIMWEELGTRGAVLEKGQRAMSQECL